MAESLPWSSGYSSVDAQLGRTRSAGQKTKADWNRAATSTAAETRRMLAEYSARRPRGGTPWDPYQRAEVFESLTPEDRIRLLDDVDYFSPANPAPRYTRAMGEAVRYPLEIGARPRDTLISAGQSAYSGDYGKAFGKLLSAGPSVFLPALASGRPGDPDSWEDTARDLGISGGNIAALDFLTDPTTFLGYGAAKKFGSRVLPRMAGSKAEQNIRSLSKEIEQLRRNAAKVHHPDRGGSAEVMRAINRAADEGNMGALLRYAQ